jgi:hypothetical protein
MPEKGFCIYRWGLEFNVLQYMHYREDMKIAATIFALLSTAAGLLM